MESDSMFIFWFKSFDVRIEIQEMEDIQNEYDIEYLDIVKMVIYIGGKYVFFMVK